MKIVIDARILGSSTGRYTERLLHYLQITDHKNQYIVLLTSKDFKTWQPIKPNFSKQLADFPMYSRKGLLAFGKLLNGLKPDLVHFTFHVVPPNYRGRYVVTVHDLTQLRFQNPGKTKTKLGYRFKQKQLALMLRLALRKAAFIIVPTRYIKVDLLRFRPATSTKTIAVTYEASDPQSTALRIAPVTGLTNEFILYVGNAHAHKNLLALVEAFGQLKQSKPQLQLVLAGKQDHIYKKFLNSQSASLLTGVMALGFVTDEQLAWLYQNARAYVFPSLSEGFGLPGLEAMQYGCPVVSSNATCLPEVYDDAAHYFDPTDTADMARAISDVLDNNELRTKLIAKGYEQVKKYSWEKMAKQTLEIYKSALE